MTPPEENVVAQGFDSTRSNFRRLQRERGDALGDLNLALYRLGEVERKVQDLERRYGNGLYGTVALNAQRLAEVEKKLGNMGKMVWAVVMAVIAAGLGVLFKK